MQRRDPCAERGNLQKRHEGDRLPVDCESANENGVVLLRPVEDRGARRTARRWRMPLPRLSAANRERLRRHRRISCAVHSLWHGQRLRSCWRPGRKVSVSILSRLRLERLSYRRRSRRIGCGGRRRVRRPGVSAASRLGLRVPKARLGAVARQRQRVRAGSLLIAIARAPEAAQGRQPSRTLTIVSPGSTLGHSTATQSGCLHARRA